MKQTIVTALVALACMTSSAIVHAQQTSAQQAEAQALLAGATALRCTFPMSVRTTWKDSGPQPVLRSTGQLVVTIRNINPSSGSAVAVTGSGNKDITLMLDENNRYFLDAGGGRVTLTMVLGEFSTGMKFKAAHSIHDFVLIDLPSFKSEPEIVQYWGDCEIAPPAQ